MERTEKEACQDLGRYAEMLFQADAIRMGMGVYAPVQSFPHVDCIVETRERTWRVQVKARRRARRGLSIGYLFERGGRLRYDAAAFDVLAAWLADDERWVFADANHLHGRQQVLMILDRYRNDDRAITWRDWSIFSVPAKQATLIHAELEVTA